MDAGSSQKAEVYRGSRARILTKVQQFRCSCGCLGPIELAISIDVSEDPELALRAAESGPDRALHVMHCEACSREHVANVPFTYHDGDEAIFALVLPEAWRHRELEERASLLLELAQEDALLPTYVVQFEVAYGAEGLKELLRVHRQKREGLDRDRKRLQDVEQRVQEAVLREQGIADRERELMRVTSDLDSRSSRLTERELGLHDRKSALDRRSVELERKTLALEEVKTQLRAESQGDLPALLREDLTVALDEEHILTSAPDPSQVGRGRISAKVAVSGSSEEFRSAAPTAGLEALVAPLQDTDPSGGETRVAPAQGQSVGRTRASSDVITGELNAVQDTEPRLGRVLSGHHDFGSGPMPPPTEIGDNDVTMPASKDNDVEAWRKTGRGVLKLLRGQEVRLAAGLHAGALDELLASDIRALLQFHRMPSYPLVSLTLARASTLGGEGGQPFSFHFDVGEVDDRAVLEALAKDFRFTLDLYDADHRPMRQRRLAAPLAANVRYVMTLATDARKDIAPRIRSFKGAINAFDNERHDRLGRMHPLARDFRDSLLDKIAKPRDLIVAMAQCEKFSEPSGEEYLVAIRSYPFDRWHQRRLQVIRRALELGLWMGPALARVAVSEELVRSRKELITTCQQNFAKFVDTGRSGMSKVQVASNWALLNEEALAIGLSAPVLLSTLASPAASTTLRGMASVPLATPQTQSLNEPDSALLDRLQQPEARLQAIVQLCERKTLSGVDPLFRALAELPFEEAAEAFAAITFLGNQAAEALLVLLSCPSSHLRHGAAMALCELRNDVGVDSICEELMQDEGTIWREYAYALGRVGSSAIMPLVARIGAQGKRGQARAVWSLGYIAAQGARKPVETLAGGRDPKVSAVATAALELVTRLETASVAVDRNMAEQAYSERFYRALAGTPAGYAGSDRSGPAMLLDDADLMEAIE